MVMSIEEAYEVLQLSKDATISDIKVAYKHLALKTHPDKRDPSEREKATEEFQRLSLAYKRLTGTESEVASLEEKFKDPTFMWYLFCALFGYDNNLFFEHDDSSDDEEPVDCFNYRYMHPPSSSALPNQWHSSRYSRQSRKSAEDAEKIANELIADEERQKRKANKKVEKRRKKRERKMKKKIEKAAANGTGSSSGGAACTNNGGVQHSNGGVQHSNGGSEDDGSTDSQDDLCQRMCGDMEEEQFDTSCAFVASGMKSLTVAIDPVAPSPPPPAAANGLAAAIGGRKQAQQMPQHHLAAAAACPADAVHRVQAGRRPHPSMRPLASQQLPSNYCGTGKPPAQPIPPPYQQQLQQQNYQQDPVLTARQLAKAANARMAAGDLHGALELYGRAIGLDPTDCRYYGSRAACLYQLGRYEESERAAAQSVQLSPIYARGFYVRGLAQSQLGAPSAACASFASVLALDPGNADAAQQLQAAQLAQLEAMGFRPDLCRAALSRFGGRLDEAANWLLGRASSATAAAKERPPSRPPSSYAKALASPEQRETVTQAQPYEPKEEHYEQQQKTRYKVFGSNKQAIAAAADPLTDPSNPHQSTALWVGNVMPDVTDEQLCAAFAQHGGVASARLLRQSCCAFVNMRSPADAARALAGVNGLQVGSRRLVVKFSASGPPRSH